MTRKLYHEDQYLTTFSSKVVEHLEVEGKFALLLEQTAFYPASGGQPYDLGTIQGIPVCEVVENDTRQILHLLERPVDKSVVDGRIDWPRRFEHMQQHSGQHLLSQAFIKVCRAETVSFHLGEDISTVDVNQAGLTEEQIIETEELANQIVYENREILSHWVARDELDQFPVRKMPVVEENIRIIEIKDFDFSPCGGTHCSGTGEIGMIKVRKWEHYKGGTRVQFLCGWRALRDYQHKTAIMRQLSVALTSGEADLPQNITKLQEDVQTLRREQAALTKQLLEFEVKTLLAERTQNDDVFVLAKIFTDRNPKDLKVLANMVLERSPKTVVLFGGKAGGKASLIFLRSDALPFDMNALMKTACEVMNGRGGGQPHQAQGGGTEVERLEEALHYAHEALFREG